MYFVSALISLLAFTSATSEVCSQGPDRDLSVFIGHDATSNCHWVAYTLPHIAEGVIEVNNWVTGAGYNMAVSTARMGDRTRTGDACFIEDFHHESPAAAADRLKQYTAVTYAGKKAPVLQSVMYMLASKWNSPAANERRIVMIVSSHTFPLGHGFELEAGKTLQQLCPIENHPTSEQMSEMFRKNGLGLFFLNWHQWIEGSWLEGTNVKSAMARAGITDYKLYSYGWKTDGVVAKQLFEDNIRELACPTWLATTTTYKPSIPANKVQECVEEAQLDLKDALMTCMYNQ